MEEAMKRELDAWLEEFKQRSSAYRIPLELFNKLRSLLLQCVQKGYADVLKEAFEKIPLARRATIDDLHRTALHLAVEHWKTVSVEPMLESVGPKDLLIQDKFGQTALHIAILKRNPELSIRMLKISPGLGNTRNGKGETPLILAACNQLKDVCIHMIERSCVENSHMFVQNLNKDTAFHQAVNNGWKNLCSLLIERASEDDLLLQNNDGDTVLHVAIKNKMPELCIRMLEISPRLGNIQNRNANTPLILAIHNGLEDLCIHMIERSCVERSFIFVKNSSRETAFHWATFKGMRKLCRLLIKRASADDLRVKTESGKTSLHLALDNGNFEMAHQMLQVNPSLGEERTGEGKTPLDILVKKASSVISSRAQLGVIDSLIYPSLDNDEGLQKQESWLRKMFYKFLALTLVERVEKIRNKKQQYLLICDLIYKLASLEESPLVIVAELGLTELVKTIMNENPQAIDQRRSSDKKNAVLLAAENRRCDVYELLLHHCRKKNIHSDIFGREDYEGNNALHLVAKFDPNRRPWRMPGNTAQMHWEIKWYKYVKYSIPEDLWMATNKEGLTPAELFKKEHGDLFKSEVKGEWVSMTSQAFSVVAGLIATVAFSSATTIPGSNSEKGYPNFRGRPALSTFVISSFIALFFSLISLIRFLSILISPLDDLNDVLNYDYCRSLPEELIKGLTTLFLSIVAMLVSFCAGHYFYLKGTTLFLSIPVYLIGCLIIASFFFKKVYSSFLFYAVRRKPEPWYEISK